jgi:hypothetical protein
LLKDFHTLVDVKNKLSSADLSEEERSKLQEEYNSLLNQYFEVK